MKVVKPTMLPSVKTSKGGTGGGGGKVTSAKGPGPKRPKVTT